MHNDGHIPLHLEETFARHVNGSCSITQNSQQPGSLMHWSQFGPLHPSLHLKVNIVTELVIYINELKAYESLWPTCIR